MKMKTRGLLILGVILGALVMMVWLASTVPTQTELELIAHANRNGVSVTDYPDSLVELMEQNPEAKGFVLNYPFREEKEADLSEFDSVSGVPLFLQWDERWGYQPWGDDFVGVSGSALMCLAMTGWHLSGGDGKFSPQKVAAFARENGYDSGKRVIRDCGSALGLEVTEFGRDERKLSVYLKNGSPVIAQLGGGDGSDGGRCIVITGYALGRVSIRDPGSRINSEKTWDYADFAHQVQRLWVIRLEAQG